MWTVLIPIVCIGGFLVVFYLFKDKFTGKYMKAYDEANKAWADDKEGVIAEMFSNPDRFKMLQDAVGEDKIESLCPCQPKKSFAKSVLKGGVEVLTARQTFDMSLYFFALAGGELHLMQTSGKMVVSHDAWKLENLTGVDIRPEGNVTKVANMLTSNNSTAPSRDSIFFTSQGEDYSFKLLDTFQDYARFEVEKGYSSGKHGDNPFYRVSKGSQTDVTILTGIYGPETIAAFREAILKLKA